MGPTASGKSGIAFQAARRLGAEVVSIDSMQVYRGMDIGTAKPSVDERREVVHHMLDLVDPSDEYTVSEFQTQARGVIEGADRPLILVGGSGLHMRSVIDPLTFEPSEPELRSELEALQLDELGDRLLKLDPAAGEHVDLANPRRVVRAVEIAELTGRSPSVRAREPERRMVDGYQSLYDVTIVGVDPGDELEDRAHDRIEEMFLAGLVDEVKGLQGRMGRTASQAVGYREVVDLLQGRSDESAARQAILSATLALAKRQRTWFRRDPRVRWLTWSGDADTRIEAVLREWSTWSHS